MKKSSFSFTRRQAIFGLAALGISPLAIYSLHQKSDVYVSAQGDAEENFSLGAIESKHHVTNVHSSFRGHGLAQHPKQKNIVVMVGRRPSTEALSVDLKTGHEQIFSCSRHNIFEGHACFSTEGTFLYASESRKTNGEGIIGIYHGKTFERLGEFSSYGIGPHEIKSMPDKHRLVIANGGIFSRNRKAQNLHTMQSNLTYIDTRNGTLLNQYTVEEVKASIRHLDVAADGSVALAMQVQRCAMQGNQLVALSAIQLPGQNIKVLPKPGAVISRLHDYMGSVAINDSNRIAGFTSPKGNLAAFWHMDSGTFVGYHEFHDVCGIAVSPDQQYFVLSNSAGKLRQLHASDLQEDVSRRMHFSGMRWDNHLLSIG